MDFRVEDVRGCKVIFGPIGMEQINGLVVDWSHGSPDWVLDARLAQHLGATIVAGTVEATTQWRSELGMPRR